MRRGRSHSLRAACVPPGITHLPPPPRRRRSSAASAQLGVGGKGGGGAALEYLGLAFLPGIEKREPGAGELFCHILLRFCLHIFNAKTSRKRTLVWKVKGCYCVIFHDESDGSSFSFLTRRHPPPSTRFQRPVVSRAARRSARG